MSGEKRIISFSRLSRYAQTYPIPLMFEFFRPKFIKVRNIYACITIVLFGACKLLEIRVKFLNLLKLCLQPQETKQPKRGQRLLPGCKFHIKFSKGTVWLCHEECFLFIPVSGSRLGTHVATNATHNGFIVSLRDPNNCATLRDPKQICCDFARPKLGIFLPLRLKVGIL